MMKQAGPVPVPGITLAQSGISQVRGRGPHQVLVSLRIDIFGHQSSVGGAVRVLIRRQGVGAQLSSQLDLVLDGAILRREVHCSMHSTGRVLHEDESCA